MPEHSKTVFQSALNEARKLVDQAQASASASLSFKGLAIRELPSNLVELSNLTHLDLGGCRELVSLRPLAALTSLQSLNLSGCWQLEDLQPLGALTGLQSLDLHLCWQLQDLQPLAALTSLQSLDLSECSHLQDLQPLNALTSLQLLNLSDCPQLQDLQPLAAFSSLQSLNLSFCSQLQDLQPLTALTSLQSLNLSRCEQLQTLQALANLTRLQSLDLSGCPQLQDLQPLAALTSLHSLDLNGCSQIQDLQPLAALTSLQSLDLSECSQLQDLQPLADRSHLQSLALRGCEQLQDLQPLAALTSIQSLNLSYCSQLQDLQPLTTLTSLQSLTLRDCPQLEDLQPLAALTTLQSLDLSSCPQVQDLQPLAALTSLQSLSVSNSEQLQDLQPLAALTSLQSLNLGDCEQLQDLQPLAALTSLQSLQLSRCLQLQDLRPLATLTSLQSLNLSRCEQLQDLRPLAALTSLQSLYLFGCSQLQDLQPLVTLTGLQSLDLSYCSQLQDLQPLATTRSLREVHLIGIKLDCNPEASPLSCWIRLDELYADQLIAAPKELGSKNEYNDNALPRIRAWQHDLLSGEASNSTIKILFLGNGRVGKTQLCRRLQGKSFDRSIPTTHGIDLEQHQLLPASADHSEITARFWDFGGQSIYHATHSLFLDDRAIYVLAWTPGYENTDQVEENGIVMRNRRLAYWLEYVRSLAGPAAPVIVVQTQCDRESDRRDPPIPANHGFERLLTTYSSAREPNGIRRVRLELESAALYQLERYGKVRLPKSWCGVEKDIAARRRRKTKTITYSEFETLSQRKHQTAVPGVVLQYLHRAGQVFYREGTFNDRVILDLDWAFDGIYAVLDRKKALPILKAQAGRFTPQLLAALVWQQYSAADHELFISLMQQCQVCFKTADSSFVAIEALPSQEKVSGQIQQLWRNDATPDAAASLDYPFLHEGVLRATLCKVGEKAGENAVYWLWGVCFYDVKSQCTARIRAEPNDPAGCIIIEATGAQSQALVSHLVESVLQINIGAKPVPRWIHGSPSAPGLNQLEPQKPGEAFAQIAPGQPPRLPGEPLPVYVSYAWGGESDALVDTFVQQLPESFTLIRDKTAMRPGDWIPTFMRHIGRGDHVLVVLSEKYLQSVYCMRELLYLYQTSLGERADFLDRVVVLTVGDTLKFSRAADRAAHALYWQEEDKKLDLTLSQLERISISDADRAEQRAIKDFAHHVSDILSWVAGTLMPKASGASQESIDAAVALLQQRLAAPRATVTKLDKKMRSANP